MNHRACGLTMEVSLRPRAIALSIGLKHALRILSRGAEVETFLPHQLRSRMTDGGTGPWHTGRLRCISANDRMDSIEHAQRGMKPEQVSEPGVIITPMNRA